MFKYARSNRKSIDKFSFTMIELLVVIGIIAIMATMLTGSLTGGSDKSLEVKAKAEMAAFVAAKISADATGATVSNLGKDPWGSTYSTATWNSDFERWEISSNGPDKQSGTTDDIYSWK